MYNKTEFSFTRSKDELIFLICLRLYPSPSNIIADAGKRRVQRHKSILKLVGSKQIATKFSSHIGKSMFAIFF